MHSQQTGKTERGRYAYWLCLTVSVCLGLLSLWTWYKWDTAWIERSESFFPPEWQQEDLATLAWKYPIYRSNDSYQWVHIADALAVGNHTPLYHRFDEGPPEGRPNRWHSGLAHLLHASGSLTATLQDWPRQRGIHHAAHWLGTLIHLCAIAGGFFLISRLAGKSAALLFAGLYYFNAAIAWDFAFSRLDHEAILQFFFLFHLLGLAGLFTQDTKRRRTWALIAGITAGGCWWVSATVMSALSALITLGLAIECFRIRKDASSEMLNSIILWGGSAAAMIGLLCIIDGRLSPIRSIATIHPIFIFAQIGASLVCLSILLSSKVQKTLLLGIGLLCGLSPAIWLAIYQGDAHPWLNPMMRRLHDHIVEFQSPFSNGLWGQPESIQALATCFVALLSLRLWSKSRASLFAPLLIGLALLSILQTRWLGLLAASSVLALCLQIQSKQMPIRWYLSLSILLLSSATWVHKWSTIEDKPGRIFITDLMLQIGARDINLNLQRLAQGEAVTVAMPYAFAASSALFPEVHPVGTFYWENATGLEASANFFAGLSTDTQIDYAVVQGGRQGAPFAKLANWVAKGDVSPASIEASLVWQLSAHAHPDGWNEQPYYGTFGTDQFSVRIFSNAHPR